MMDMMTDPVAAMALLFALVTVLAALTVTLRVLGSHDGSYRPHRPQTRTTRAAARALQARASRTSAEHSPEQ